MARLRMHAELRSALDGNKAMSEFQRMKEAAEMNGQLTEELDDTRGWLQRAMQERGQVERELVLEVRRLKDELTMARVSLANEGAETRARLAKADISAQRAERRMMREKEHGVRLQRTMDAVVRAIDNDSKRNGLLPMPTPASQTSGGRPASRLSQFELPSTLPSATRAIIDVEDVMADLLNDVRAALTNHDQGNLEEEPLQPLVAGQAVVVQASPAEKRYALTTNLRKLRESLVVLEVSASSLEDRASKALKDLTDTTNSTSNQNDQSTALALAGGSSVGVDGVIDPVESNIVAAADMTIINRRLCERLKLIKERAMKKEETIRLEYTYTQEEKLSGPLHRSDDLLMELKDLAEAYLEGQRVAEKAAEDQREALEAEEKVKTENAAHDIVDVIPTMKLLYPYAKKEEKCDDDTVGPRTERINRELRRQVACMGRLEAMLESTTNATFAQCNAINAARKTAQEIVDDLKNIESVCIDASTRYMTKDKMLPDQEESVEKKMQRFKGNLKWTVYDGYNFQKEGSDTAKWSISVRQEGVAEVQTLPKKAGPSPVWNEGFDFGDLEALENDFVIDVNCSDHIGSDAYYTTRIKFRPLLRNVAPSRLGDSEEYILLLGLSEPSEPGKVPPPHLSYDDQFKAGSADFSDISPGDYGMDRPDKARVPYIKVGIVLTGDVPNDDELLTKVHEMLQGDQAPTESQQNEAAIESACNKALSSMGDLGPKLMKIAGASMKIAEHMPHLNLPSGIESPARVLSPTRHRLALGDGGDHQGLMSPNTKAREADSQRHSKFMSLTQELQRSVSEVKQRSEELPDIVSVYFKDCFAVLDPGLAMVEDSLVRDAAYAKLAKLRGHAAVQARTACTLLAELDEDVEKEANGRILSRDKKFLDGVRSTLAQSVASLEELARVGTEGVATKAEVREMQMENRALMSTMARGEWKRNNDGQAVARAQAEVDELQESLARSQGEITRLNSRSQYLATQAASTQGDQLAAMLSSEEKATRELSQKLMNERSKKNQLENELLKAEEIVSQLLQEEMRTGGALAKVIRAVQ